jgi:hypothetical protein
MGCGAQPSRPPAWDAFFWGKVLGNSATAAGQAIAAKDRVESFAGTQSNASAQQVMPDHQSEKPTARGGKAPAKESKAKFRKFAKRQDLFDKYLFQGMRFLDKAEAVLVEDYERYKSRNELEMLEHSLAALASFEQMVGRSGKAEQYLREREATFPQSLEAKLAIARYFGHHLHNYHRALDKLNEIELPQTPRQYDFDTVYNVLSLKGVALLHMSQLEKAGKAMAELAAYTEKHFSKIVFFLDLSFVEMMVERRLALPHCRAYLKTLQRHTQVIHDQKKALALLRQAESSPKP